ncbi:DNA polymerase III subunit delta' [Priestia flexa]|uniref:DNA polymerase III subunit delta' n=1 Tax=Priestia flexa TaxID=86664 RepID=UPI00099BBC67|nr:DNA polymerase III subunit delta' [Priestia flexa]AQX52977.1 DNA polymerase III subunit delta' [Priestia flexa]
MNKKWGELEGVQPTALRMLKNSIVKDRVAHAYLLEGSKGTGKKEISFLFAKRLFCLNPHEHEPCYECINCKRIDSGNHPDVHFIEPDGLSIKKEQVQYLQAEFTKTGVESNKKLYIINHVDKMTVSASNSLLKFLEEPTDGTYAILLTETIQKLLDTIISRCQVISLRSLTEKQLAEQLMNHNLSRADATLMPYLTNSITEAIELSEDEWFGLARKLVIQLYEVLTTRPQQALLFIHEKWVPHFKEKEEAHIGLNLLMLLYRDVLTLQVEEEPMLIYFYKEDHLKSHALQATQQKIIAKIEVILRAKNKLNSNMNIQLLMEQLVLDLQEG